MWLLLLDWHNKKSTSQIYVLLLKKKSVLMHYVYSDFHFPLNQRKGRVPGFCLLWVSLPLLGSILMEVKRGNRCLLLLDNSFLHPLTTPPITFSFPQLILCSWKLFVIMPVSPWLQRNLVHVSLTLNSASLKSLPLVTCSFVTAQSLFARIISHSTFLRFLLLTKADCLANPRDVLKINYLKIMVISVPYDCVQVIFIPSP